MVGLPRQRPWRWQHYVAGLAIPFLVWEAWTIAAWVADGPYQVTQYRDKGTAAWVAARVYASVMVVVASVVLWSIVRSLRRQRRLTFDASFAIATSLAYVQDPMLNWFQPVFSYSSNWVNLTSWCSNAPWIVNPDCGRLVEPVLFIGLIYAFGLLAAAMLGCWVLRHLSTRYPQLSFARQLGCVVAVGAILDLVLEIPLIHLRLWSYIAIPEELALFGGETRFPLVNMLAGGVFFGIGSALRFFRNDRGETIFERGLDHLPPRRRTALTLLSMIGFIQVLFMVLNSPYWVLGTYADPVRDVPAHTVNGICDIVGSPQTRYGACPGSPGYRAPLRSLPGSAPPKAKPPSIEGRER